MKNKQKDYLVLIAYVLIDVTCAIAAVLTACSVRNQLLHFPISFQAIYIDDLSGFKNIFFFWTALLLFFNRSRGLYQTKRELIEGAEIWRIIQAVFLTALTLMVIIYLSKIEGFPRSIFVLMNLLVVIFSSVWRIAKRMFVEFLVRRGYNNFNVLIIGAGKIGYALAGEIRRHPGYGYRIVGFLDSDPSGPFEDHGGADMPVIGRIEDFSKIARKEFIHQVFISVHPEGDVFLNLLQQARELGIAVKVIPVGFELSTGDFMKYNVGYIPVLEYCAADDRIKQFGKRFFDVALSLVSLIVLFPFFLLIGILIKLESPGPVLYVSRRYGKKGEVFGMLKFRSMTRDAETRQGELRGRNEADGPIFKLKNDPRITRVGRFLRRYSLDELPQLINVITGDMSLVGPRPFPIDQIEREDINQLKRLEVRPGITGMWQISGRSDISFSSLIKWDIWYINNWSFWLDVSILLQTIPVVLKGKGAY